MTAPGEAARPAAFADFELVQPEILDGFPALVTELGGDPAPLLDSVGLKLADLSGGRATAHYRQLIQLLDRAAATLDCPDFGMRLAQRQQGWRSYGPLGGVMRHSRTFRDAVGYAAAHCYAHSLAARVWMRPFEEDGMTLCGHDILIDGLVDHAQAIEQILLVGSLGARQLTGGRARVRRVHFRHQPVAAPAVYRRHFGCDVLFGQAENGVIFNDQDMACAIADPDAGSYRIAAASIESGFVHRAPPMQVLVRGAVIRLLESGQCSRAEVAAEIGLHNRTIQRRLAEEHTSFQEIKDSVRRDLLIYYATRTRLAFTLVAERLGFSEQAVMTRLCNRWFGTSPRRLRERSQTGRVEAACG